MRVSSLLQQYRKSSGRRHRRHDGKRQRLDIQGLRMVAVLTVFANHLTGWPTGGFIGVDVFFVISGFLITGNLMRTAESTGTVSFRSFYWNRVRRIVPAATVVLILTYLVATLVFQPFRAHQVGVDALYAFVFLSNWHFEAIGTDYFRAASETVSPIQHYWSLSIEEQFYFVWPAVIFLISVLVVRKSWPHARRMVIAGAVMGAIVTASLWWALVETATSPISAYFNTFARVWELGVGALLAISAGALARIPAAVKPFLSWAGLACITATLYLLTDGAPGFPAPWALLPVTGAALVIAAGIGGEPEKQAFLRNPVSTYIGDISYSLYLVHWPVIIFVGAMMDPTWAYYLTVVAVTFGLAIGSYHLVENPLRRGNLTKLRAFVHEVRRSRYRPKKSTQYAMAAAAALLIAGLVSFSIRPDAYVQATPPPPLAATADGEQERPSTGPLADALQAEIVAALEATSWPALEPSMESVVSGNMLGSDVSTCAHDKQMEDLSQCTVGSPTAPVRIVLVGDSVGLGYADSLGQIASNSNGQLQLIDLAMGSCSFTKELIERPALSPTCEARKTDVVNIINTTKPTVVIVSNRYSNLQVVGEADPMTADGWGESLRQQVDLFRANAGQVVFFSAPPGEADIKECFSKKSSTPADCIGTVTDDWRAIARSEQGVAEDVGGVFVDSWPWFCSGGGLCPAFVGTTPARFDRVHMSAPYSHKIAPVIDEALRAAKVY
jgi:peptidoglycan/LPS O-acetylase OafA/YrhL